MTLIVLAYVMRLTRAMILVIAALDSTRVYRLSRAVAQGILTMDYIEVARMRGPHRGHHFSAPF